MQINNLTLLAFVEVRRCLWSNKRVYSGLTCFVDVLEYHKDSMVFHHVLSNTFFSYIRWL